VPAVEKLVELGFSLIATGGTAAHLAAQGLPVERVNKVAQGRPHIVDRISTATSTWCSTPPRAGSR
jgi:carbamoyl-phosphate synthase large subunit